MSLCTSLAALGPQARNLLATSEARQLAVALGVSPAAMMALASSGALDRLCASVPGAVPLASALQLSINAAGTGAPANGTVYDNCRVVMMPDGNMRVMCPDATPSGGCGCGNNCPAGCIPATQTGNANCLPSDPTFAPCTVEQVCSAYKFAPITASWTGGPGALGAGGEPLQLFERISATRYVLTIPPIGAASRSCLTSVQLAVDLNGGAGPVEQKPTAVAYNCSRLRQQPEGQWVWTWDTPSWVYGPSMVMTDGRCTCPPGALCCCQVYNGPTRVTFDTLTNIVTTATTTITVAFAKDACGEAQCGPCPPGLICGTTLLLSTYVNSAGVPVSPQAYIWGGGLPPQEPVLNLGSFIP